MTCSEWLCGQPSLADHHYNMNSGHIHRFNMLSPSFSLLGQVHFGLFVPIPISTYVRVSRHKHMYAVHLFVVLIFVVFFIKLWTDFLLYLPGIDLLLLCSSWTYFAFNRHKAFCLTNTLQHLFKLLQNSIINRVGLFERPQVQVIFHIHFINS